MMSTPLARAAATVRFIAGASSPTRRVAPRHQCWFHMSQMMIAVRDGSQRSVFSCTGNPSPPDAAVFGTGSRHPGLENEGIRGPDSTSSCAKPPAPWPDCRSRPPHRSGHTQSLASLGDLLSDANRASVPHVEHSLNNLLWAQGECHLRREPEGELKTITGSFLTTTLR